MDRFCIHSITNKPWSLVTLIEKYTESNIPAITIWEDAIKEHGAGKTGKILQKSGLEVISYCRGGFFPDIDPVKRQNHIEHNKQMIQDASSLGAPIMVLVCGADPGLELQESREQIKAGIDAILPLAEKAGVKLAIEPLHPMYADTRSAVNNMATANDMAEYFDSEWVGVAIDVYHVWWDPDLKTEILRCGRKGNILAFHICDWKVPTQDLLLDRELMGRGCIPVKEISDWIDEAGFQGFREVEIFSNHYWEQDQDGYLKEILQAYHKIYN